MHKERTQYRVKCDGRDHYFDSAREVDQFLGMIQSDEAFDNTMIDLVDQKLEYNFVTIHEPPDVQKAEETVVNTWDIHQWNKDRERAIRGYHHGE